MIQTRNSVFRLIAIGVSLLAGCGMAAQREMSAKGNARIVKEVRHELAMLPYYTVFDNLAFEANGGTVTLIGQVTRPTLKSDAENAVKKIEGVDRVVNKIEVLPPAPADDRIRLATYRAIYSESSLQRYAVAAIPSIHIIVNNGRVTLDGVVDNEADKNIANLRASSVPGTFGVTNNLKVQKE